MTAPTPTSTRHTVVDGAKIIRRDPDELRPAFQIEHPYCAAAEIWHEIDGEPTLLRIECGTPTEHRRPPQHVPDQ